MHFFKTSAGKLRGLDRNFLSLVGMFSCLSAFLTVINLFMNTFLLKASGDSTRVMIYNLILGGFQPLAMVAAVFVLRRTSPIRSQRISFLLYALVFLTMAVLGRRAADYYCAIAMLIASAAGFFYVTYCLQVVSYTNDANMDASQGLLNVASSVINLVFPIVSGYVLSRFVDFTGYRILFLFVLALTGLALYFSAHLSPLSEFDNSRRVFLRDVSHTLATDPMGRRIGTLTAIAGLRDGTFLFIFPMLIYQLIHSEAIVGLNSTLGSVCAILASSLYGCLVTPKRRGRSAYFAVTIISLALVPLFFRLDTVTLIIFSLVYSLMNLFISLPQVNVYYSILQHLPAIKGKGAEAHTVREFYYAAGRTAGILLLMAMPRSPRGYVAAMLILTLMQYLSAGIVERAQRELLAKS